METLEINDQFRRAYEFANETNRCIFLTGKAGTGKTTLLKYIRDNCFKQISIVAPTGVAAINAGGTTIHSFFQLPFSPFVPPADKSKPSEQGKQLMATIKLNNIRRGVMSNLELLIIDEVSMVRADVLDAIDVVLRSVRRRYNVPFGGVQVMFIGDMYQLPPVAREEEWGLLSQYYKSPFFFDSHVVNEVHPVYIELDKIFRQKEQAFVDLLNKVRNNQLDDEAIEILNSRHNPNSKKGDAVILATHNYIADEINNGELAKLSGRLHSFKAEVSGTFSEKAFPADSEIQLKLGARVMFIKNDTQKRYFNGKIGTVTKLSDKEIQVTCDGETFPIDVKQEEWKNVQYSLDKSTNKIEEDVQGRFNQYPLRLAWAITIHKSQGLTFDKVEIDAQKAFSAGQVYVALSRCRSLDGIILRSRINQSSLLNDSKVLDFASRKPEGEVVDKFLVEGKSTFIQKLIFEIFNLNELLFLASDLQRSMQEYSLYFTADHTVWVSQLHETILNLKTTAQKFEAQLSVLMQNVKDAESQDALKVRLNKASTYFTAELEKIKQSLINSPLLTESKKAGKAVDGILEEMFGMLHAKIHILSSCQNEFVLQEYVKIKNELKIPEFKSKVYAVRHKVLDSSIPHPALYQELQDLRDTICEMENIPIYMVANKQSLVDMCKHLPTKKSDLLKMKGFGKAKVETIGSRFLEIINDYVTANGLESNMQLDFKKERKAKPEKEPTTDTKLQSFNLYAELKSIDLVAQNRGMARTTIEGHLAHFVKEGKLPIDDLLSKEKQEYLSPIFAEHPNFNGFAEIMAKCRADISYGDLRVFAAGMGK